MTRIEPVDPAIRARAVRAAQDLEPFDVLLVGGRVLDVAMGEIREADVGIVGPLIASVHPPGDLDRTLSVIDCGGKIIAPGFIDMHVHVESSMLTPSAYADVVASRGTTTIFTDPHELANVLGVAGVRWFCDAAQGLPVRFITQAPSCVPPLPGLERSGADLLAPDIEEMLSWPEIGGLAEVMDMFGVLTGSERMASVVARGLDSGKIVSGHAAGLGGRDLQAYAAAGIHSDHEITSVADFLEKIRAGLTVELRGIIPGILAGVVEHLNSMPDLPPNLVLATDDLFSLTLIEDGGIDALIRHLVALGLSPMRALRLATLNAAIRLGREDLGLVAAGRRADLAVLTSLESLQVTDVIADGKHISTGGVMRVPSPPSADVPVDTIVLPPLTRDDFRFRVPADDGRVRVRSLARPVMTSWSEVEVDVRGGFADIPPGCLLQVAIHRHGRAPAVPMAALLTDWADWSGAVATTLSHDTHNLVVFGTDPDEMLLAAQTVVADQGGIAVVARGSVVAKLALPIAGLLSPESAEDVARAQDALQQAAIGIGLPAGRLNQPLFQLLASCLPCLPGPHLTDIGIVDGDTCTLVTDLVLSADA
jgi:adenine deaminase